jgi:hypothetical protein
MTREDVIRILTEERQSQLNYAEFLRRHHGNNKKELELAEALREAIVALMEDHVY